MKTITFPRPIPKGWTQKVQVSSFDVPDEFEEVKEFPEEIYANDAELRITFARNNVTKTETLNIEVDLSNATITNEEGFEINEPEFDPNFEDEEEEE